MNKRNIASLIAGVALALAAGPAAQAEDYVYNDCNMQGAQCITITLNAIATGNGGGEAQWALDRIRVKIKADECRIGFTTKGGGTVTSVIPGNVFYEVPNAKTKFTRTWRVPAACPYELHMRYPSPTILAKDNIYYYTIDAVAAENDQCLNWDVRLNADGPPSGC